MVYSREQAAKRAEASKTNTPGTCQLWTRTMFGAPSAGDRDHDGDADAVDGWKSETKQHPGDRKPPRGVPVAFSGGSRGYGHRAVSLGNGKIRSTDMTSSGYKAGSVGTTTIAQIEKSMGVRYLGWSETITGIKIPTPSSTPKPPAQPVQERTLFIDVSHWQFDAGFNLSMAWNAGYRHVILKATEGTKYVDPKYGEALKQAKTSGWNVAVYHFLHKGSGAAQARHLAKNIVDKELPVFIDVEASKAGGKPGLADWVAFRNECPKVGLRVVGKYIGESYWAEIGKPNLAGPLILWRPAYPSSKAGTGASLYPGNDNKRWNSFGGQKPTFWQFTSSGTIPGYSGSVDINAFRGSRSELDKLGVFKSYGSKPEKPSETPSKASETPSSGSKKPSSKKAFDFRVHLAPGNKKETPSEIAYDMSLVKKNTGGASSILFNTERESDVARQAVKDSLGSGWSLEFSNENPIAFGKNWKVVEKKSIKLAKSDPSMAKVSPVRWLNVLVMENKSIPSGKIAFLGTHLVSEANCVHKNVYGRAWREKTWTTQLKDVLDEVKALSSSGHAMVLAGDLNTGVYFRGDAVLRQIKKVVAGDVVHVYNGSLDHVFAISSDDVALTEPKKETRVDNKSDHDMVTAIVRATSR